MAKYTKPKQWSPVDPKHFDGKGLSELQKELIRANNFTIKYPQFQYGWHNEYVHELKRLIANQIGRKL